MLQASIYKTSHSQSEVHQPARTCFICLTAQERHGRARRNIDNNAILKMFAKSGTMNQCTSRQPLSRCRRDGNEICPI